MTQAVQKVAALDYFLMNKYAIKHGIIQRNKKDRALATFPDNATYHITEDKRFYLDVFVKRLAESANLKVDQASFERHNNLRVVNTRIPRVDFGALTMMQPRADRGYLYCPNINTHTAVYAIQRAINEVYTAVLHSKRVNLFTAFIRWLADFSVPGTLLPDRNLLLPLNDYTTNLISPHGGASYVMNTPLLRHGIYVPSWINIELLCILYSDMLHDATVEELYNQISATMNEHESFWKFTERVEAEENA